MYLQDKYKVSVTNDVSAVKSLIDCDAVILDMEPSDKTKNLLEEIKKITPAMKIILTYVFKPQSKEAESSIRHFVDSIFYKPFDLNEVSSKLSTLESKLTPSV